MYLILNILYFNIYLDHHRYIGLGQAKKDFSLYITDCFYTILILYYTVLQLTAENMAFLSLSFYKVV